MKWICFSYITLPIECVNSISLHQDLCNASKEQQAPEPCSCTQELLVPVSFTGLGVVQARFPASWRECTPSFTLMFLSLCSSVKPVQLRLALSSASVKQIQCHVELKGENWTVPHNSWGKDGVVHVCCTVLLVYSSLWTLQVMLSVTSILLFQVHLSKGRLFSLPHLRLLCSFFNHKNVEEGKRQMMGDRTFSI